jgi:hypothetical protein
MDTFARTMSTTNQTAPLHPLLKREFERALERTPEQWQDATLMQELAQVVAKHDNRRELLVQLYATAHDMYDQQSPMTAAFYMAVVAVVVGDVQTAKDAAAGALDAARASQALGKHVNPEAPGVKSAMAQGAAKGVGLRGGTKK